MVRSRNYDDSDFNHSRNVYWGDFHKHITGPRSGELRVNLDRADKILEDTKQHLDIYVPLVYPFEQYRIGRREGAVHESVENVSPRFTEWWKRVQDLSAEYNQPDSFVTYPGYEWNGNRTRWGDHNVIYREEGYPLDDSWHIEELYDNLNDRIGFVIPHHTAYKPKWRSKDWDHFEGALSPVMEIFSGQGSSEGVGTPVPMENNTTMGPRANGTTFQSALDRGYKIGVIASNDWIGLPGTWNSGVAGIVSSKLTRQAVWEAIENRHTYGVTGDRIDLRFRIADQLMGSTVPVTDAASAHVTVDCPQPLQHIELIRNGRVWETYNHLDHVTRGESDSNRYRILVEMGWGPSDAVDLHEHEFEWNGSLLIEGGTLLEVFPRFSGFGQRYLHDTDICEFSLRTSQVPTENLPPSRASVYHHKQGLILEVAGDVETTLRLQLDEGFEASTSFESLLDDAHVFSLLDESKDRFETEFGIEFDGLRNPDVVGTHARKIKVHPAYPIEACRTSIEFPGLPAVEDTYYYTRVSQVDGQYAWSSPIWIE